jgi:hypothetical protein
VKLDSVIPGNLRGLAGNSFDLTGSAGDGSEQMAEAFIFDEREIEIAVVVEQFGYIASHKGCEGTDHFICAHIGFRDAILDLLLYLDAMQDLVSGLIGAGGAVAGGDCGEFAVAAVFDVLVDEEPFTVSKLGLAGGGIGFSSGHRDIPPAIG